MIRFHIPCWSSTLIVALLLSACHQASAPTATARPARGLASVNDIQMSYETHGEGTPLILLHGGLGNVGSWENQIPVLSRHYRVIAVDSRGHGRSTFSAQQIGYALMASDVIALMDYLGIAKAHILGWSDGAIIGLDLAIRHPDRLNRLIAYGANYNPSGLRADVSENRKFREYVEKAAKDYQALSPDPARWEAFQKNIGQMWATEPNFTAEQLHSIAVPTLILDGDNDEAIYTEHTKTLAGLIPRAELILISGTGHFAPLEKRDEFNRIVLEFLARQMP
ncbi:MAG TPA: alpha/beta hydrolase [Blastocatellia bacterium]|nr:alpha/beta hydrolase [Blastocatellia bacterium]